MSSEPETPQLSDVPRLLEIWLACFNDEHMHALFPPNEIGDAYLTDALTAYMREDALAKVYVIRNDQGIVDSAIVVYSQTGEKPLTWKDRWAPPRKGMNKEVFEGFCRSLDTQRNSAMGTKPHSFVETLMTHPSAQRKGYGSKLLRHVAELSGGLPTYLDSHPDATEMYERVGFVKQPDEIRTTKDAWPMVNPGTSR